MCVCVICTPAISQTGGSRRHKLPTQARSCSRDTERFMLARPPPPRPSRPIPSRFRTPDLTLTLTRNTPSSVTCHRVIEQAARDRDLRTRVWGVFQNPFFFFSSPPICPPGTIPSHNVQSQTLAVSRFFWFFFLQISSQVSAMLLSTLESFHGGNLPFCRQDSRAPLSSAPSALVNK